MKQFKNLMELTAVCLTLGIALAHCSKPTYPACENDADCKEKSEVCIDKKCMECATDDTCVQKLGAGAICKNNTCKAKDACTQDSECASGQKCENKKCVAAMSSIGACKVDGDCQSGQECYAGACRAKAKEQAALGLCEQLSAPEGALKQPILFGYDKAEVPGDAQSRVEQIAGCLKQMPKRQLVIEGHCDERGTVEYNLSLGEQRANSIASVLKRLGIETDRVRVVSKGKNEPLCSEQTEECFAKNRRVQFNLN